jgi:hypothetical protein
MSRRQVGQSALHCIIHGCRHWRWKQWPHGVLMASRPKRDMGRPQQMLHSVMLLLLGGAGAGLQAAQQGWARACVC